MQVIEYKVECGLNGNDFEKDRRTLHVKYRLRGQAERQTYVYTFPMDVLKDIGAKELASRIYSVFKLHISRPPAV